MYYQLIEECVTQIVLHKNGVDPDFRRTKRFDIDVEPLIGKFSDFLVFCSVCQCKMFSLQCSDAVGWEAGRASGL